MKIDDGMVRLAQALVDTKHLRDWFCSLQELPNATRNAALTLMADRMRKDDEDPQLAKAVASLTNPQIYRSVLQTVSELLGEKDGETKS